MSLMRDILDNTKKEIMEKGYIGNNLMAYVGKKRGFSFKMYFMGLKNGELMVLPIANIKEPRYDQVKYYKKEEVKKFTYSTFSARIKIKLRNGGKDCYHTMRGGDTALDMSKIVAIFNS